MRPLYILDAVLIGAGATLFIDLWALFLKIAFSVRSLDYCLLGRWVLYIPQGRILHDPIAKTPPKPTVVVPFFTMQPSFGLGVAASKTPHPNKARLKGLMTHTVFGVALYVWALLLNRFPFSI